MHGPDVPADQAHANPAGLGMSQLNSISELGQFREFELTGAVTLAVDERSQPSVLDRKSGQGRVLPPV